MTLFLTLIVLEEYIEIFVRDKEKTLKNFTATCASHLNAYKEAHLLQSTPGEYLFFSPSLISVEMCG